METPSRLPSALVAAALLAGAAHAQVQLFVNDFRDLPDADPFNLDADADLAMPGVQITLRSGVEFACSMGGQWIVALPAGLFGLDRVGTEDLCRWGDLDVFQSGIVSLEVRGVLGQTVIDAGPLAAQGGPERIFDLKPNLQSQAQVTLRNLVLRSGQVVGRGGGVRLEGGQLALVDTRVESCVAQEGGGLWIERPFTMGGGRIADCLASTPSSIGRGGGAYAASGWHPTFAQVQLESNQADQRGGGLYVASGAQATLDQCQLTGNRVGIASGGSGGGVAAFGSLWMTGCSVVGNQANAGTGGGVLVSGSGVGASISASTFVQNSAGSGGGLATVVLAGASVDQCTFFDNTATALGGGWAHLGSAASALSRSTLQANVAPKGGGMHVFAGLGASNSTFSGNTADEGGALHFGSGAVSLFDCTIAYNQAPIGAGVRIDASLGNPQVQMQNSILAENLTPLGTPQNFAGAPGFTFATRNLDSDGTCGVSPLSNIVGLNGHVVDAKLLPLTYFGVTATHALGSDSPAIGSGVCLSSADQNGTPRTPPCDMGAFESNLKIPWTTTYCTSKTTTIPGCLAKLAGFGLPLVSTPQNFSILCSDVPGNNPGIFFWGLSGPASTPFAGGFLCVAGTIKRSGLLPATGNTGVCNGSFWFGGQGFGSDWVQGQTIWTQCWFRDPGGILSSAFSDALSVTVL